MQKIQPGLVLAEFLMIELLFSLGTGASSSEKSYALLMFRNREEGAEPKGEMRFVDGEQVLSYERFMRAKQGE